MDYTGGFMEKTEQELTADYQAACDEYETKVEEINQQRKEHRKNLYEEKLEWARKLSSEERIDEAVRVQTHNEFLKYYVEWVNYEILYHAVRKADNHNELAYSSSEDIRQLPDEIRTLLTKKYNELDSVKPSEVPTMPAE